MAPAAAAQGEDEKQDENDGQHLVDLAIEGAAGNRFRSRRAASHMRTRRHGARLVINGIDEYQVFRPGPDSRSGPFFTPATSSSRCRSSRVAAEVAAPWTATMMRPAAMIRGRRYFGTGWSAKYDGA